jgi:hypothetical protein
MSIVFIIMSQTGEKYIQVAYKGKQHTYNVENTSLVPCFIKGDNLDVDNVTDLQFYINDAIEKLNYFEDCSAEIKILLEISELNNSRSYYVDILQRLWRNVASVCKNNNIEVPYTAGELQKDLHQHDTNTSQYNKMISENEKLQKKLSSSQEKNKELTESYNLMYGQNGNLKIRYNILIEQFKEVKANNFKLEHMNTELSNDIKNLKLQENIKCNTINKNSKYRRLLESVDEEVNLVDNLVVDPVDEEVNLVDNLVVDPVNEEVNLVDNLVVNPVNEEVNLVDNLVVNPVNEEVNLVDNLVVNPVNEEVNLVDNLVVNPVNEEVKLVDNLVVNPVNEEVNLVDNLVVNPVNEEVKLVDNPVVNPVNEEVNLVDNLVVNPVNESNNKIVLSDNLYQVMPQNEPESISKKIVHKVEVYPNTSAQNVKLPQTRKNNVPFIVLILVLVLVAFIHPMFINSSNTTISKENNPILALEKLQKDVDMIKRLLNEQDNNLVKYFYKQDSKYDEILKAINSLADLSIIRYNKQLENDDHNRSH